MQLSSNKTGLILLTLIVVVSGCADNSNQGDVTVSQTEGVSIQSFTITPGEVFENQMATVELQLKNKGGSEARDVQARLYNIPFEGDRDWNIESGENPTSFNNLRAPDPDTDAPAVSVPKTWNLEAPNLNQGVTIPYDLYTRVFYKYDTTATTDIQIMTDQRFREQGATRSTPTVDNSGGPIQLDFRTRTPVVLFEGGQNSDVCVVVENEGSGTPFDPDSGYGDISQEDIDKVDLSLQASGTVGVDGAEETVSMVGGRGVQCFTLNINELGAQGIQQTVPITITADYGYYQETSTSVTVKGRSDSGDGDGGGDTSD